MRLYLSSFRVGDHPDVLRDLVSRATSGTPRALVVANAVDIVDPDERADRVAEELTRLEAVGFVATELDLRHHAGAAGVPAALEALVARHDLLWLRGGNVFVLRHLLAASGLDRLLPRLLAEDAIAVGGYSAGPCVLAAHLRGLEACDPPEEVSRLHGEPARYDGLGVLPAPVVPHLDTPDHHESAVLERVAARHRASGTDFLGLRDGDVFVVDGAVSDGRVLPRRR